MKKMKKCNLQECDKSKHETNEQGNLMEFEM